MRGLICAAALLALLVGLATYERPKTKLDREVDRLCAVDGGVHIYESVTLTKENFGPDGEVFPQYRHLFLEGKHLSPDYYEISGTAVLHSGSPALQRDRLAIARRIDNKILGEFINYKRSGGDMPGPWEPSHKGCPQSDQSGTFYQRVFVRESKWKHGVRS